MNQTTIAAIATPAGTGGIAVIRISGPQAISIVEPLFRPIRRNLRLAETPGYTLHYGQIIDKETPLDDVMIALFRAPHSYTGEETIEISCHGSLFIQQQILQLLIRQGAQTAAPGEFTQRAFLNGKLDLSQAEAVADLIAARSAAAHRIALEQLRGGFSQKLADLRQRLLDFASLIELELDFSEEEVEFASRPELTTLAIHIEQTINRLIQSFDTGNAIKNGIPIAIVGETNAGKSTLLNLLIKEERAIVSDIHGTTRDTIEETLTIGGYLFRLIDTAGIRQTSDAIESIGIERSFDKMRQARIILWIIDANTSTLQIQQLKQQISDTVPFHRVIPVINKIDTVNPNTQYPLENPIRIAAKLGIGEEELTQRILNQTKLDTTDEQDIIITNLRHYEALTQAHQAIKRTLEGIEGQLPTPLLTQDIRLCMHYLGEITGQISTDDLLKNIFSRFCIGK